MARVDARCPFARASSLAVWPRRLVEPPRAPDLTLQRERFRELGLDLRPRLRAPACVEHHAQNAIDAEPGVPEPYDHIPRFRGCPSNGERCDVCEVLIADTVIEGISSEVTRRKIDVTTGCFAGSPESAIDSYPVKIVDGKITVALS